MTPAKYLVEHGIKKETVKEFGLTITKDSIIIPIKDAITGKTFEKTRLLNPAEDQGKFTTTAGSTVSIFVAGDLKEAKEVIITEGEFDAMQIWQHGYTAISSTGGANSWKKEWSTVLQGKKIIVAGDNDKAGEDMIRKISEIVDISQILTWPGEHKDACSYFGDNSEAQLFDLLINNTETYGEWISKRSNIKILDWRKMADVEYPKLEWIVKDFIPEQGITMVAGESGVGKSYLSSHLAACVATGRPFLGKFDTRQTGVFLFDKENGERRIHARLKGLRTDKSAQIYFPQDSTQFGFDGKNSAHIESRNRLKYLIESKQVGLVVIDSLIDVLIGDENSSGDTTVLFESIRALPPCAWLILHHNTKPSSKGEIAAQHRARGSGNIIAQVDYMFGLERADTMHINVRQGKSRDVQTLEPFGVEMVSEDGVLVDFKYDTFMPIDDKNKDVLSEEIIDRAVEILLLGDLKAEELKDKLLNDGFISKNINKALNTARADRTIKYYKIGDEWMVKAG